MNKRKIILIGAGVAFALFIVLLFIFGGSSGTKNIPTQETLTTNFGSVVCEVEGEENLTYDISILTNEIQFDSTLKTKPYTKIKINHNSNFNSLGVAFMLKTSENSNFNLALKKNNEILKTFNLQTEANQVNNIDLVLENSVEILTTDELSIVIDSPTNFVFDTMLIFTNEV